MAKCVLGSISQLVPMINRYASCCRHTKGNGKCEDNVLKSPLS